MLSILYLTVQGINIMTLKYKKKSHMPKLTTIYIRYGRTARHGNTLIIEKLRSKTIREDKNPSIL